MTPDLDAIEARIAAATPGPWEAVPTTGNAVVAPDDDGYWTDVADRIETPENADLIAHAPTDLAALLAEVERLSRRLGMTRDNAADDLAELRAENERLLAVAEAAWALTGDPDDPAWRKLSAALDAWRAGGGA